MPATGTIINVFAIILGGILGLVLRRFLSNTLQDSLLKATGLCVLFLGIRGAVEGFLENDSIDIILIFSLVLGTLLGEWIDIEGKLELFGQWLKYKTKSQGDNAFLEAFITTSLIICVGAMAVVGAIEDGIHHDPSLLIAKAVLDCIIVMVLASSLGKGCLFAFIPVAIFQGAITFLSIFIAPLLSDTAISMLSLVGSMLIFCVGFNLFLNSKIKVANMLPSLVFIVLLSYF